MSDKRVVPAQFIYPFILVTSLFALWGFANDVTNPLVKAFREIFLISNAQSSLVQVAFYGGYATMGQCRPRYATSACRGSFSEAAAASSAVTMAPMKDLSCGKVAVLMSRIPA